LQEPAISAALERMLSAPDRPTAIMVGFHSAAEIIYLCAQRLGLRVPDDLSIITVGDVRREGAIARRLTTVAIDAAALGRRTAELLYEMQAGQRAIDDIELQKGATLGRSNN
jgi:LacI family transcriptional regulator